RLQLRLEALRHQRDLAYSKFVDLAPRDRFQLAALDLQHHMLIAVLHEQAGERAAFEGQDRGRLVRSTNDETGIENVGQQVIERGPAVHGDVRADILTFAVDPVTLSADLLEDLDSGQGIAAVLAHEGTHLVDHLLALGVTLLADGAPAGLNQLDQLPVLAPE